MILANIETEGSEPAASEPIVTILHQHQELALAEEL